MAKGQPDFGQYAPTETIVSISDLGELAARLGSIVTFDRRGNVIWFDDFEGGVGKWESYLVGTGASLAACALYSRNGAFSAELLKGDKTTDHAQMSHYWPYPVLSKLGCEISFTSNDNITYIEFRQYIFDGTNRHHAELRYDTANNKLQYLDEDGNYQDLATGLVLLSGFYLFNTIKVVIDPATQQYVRVILNDVEYDMSGIDYRLTANAASPYWIQTVKIDEGIAAAYGIYVDDVILTQNEP